MRHLRQKAAGGATGVQVLLETCLATEVDQVVHVSTNEVYGSTGEGS